MKYILSGIDIFSEEKMRFFKRLKTADSNGIAAFNFELVNMAPIYNNIGVLSDKDTKDSKSDGIEVRVQDGDVWLTQNAIAQLFDIDRSVVSKHLKKIFSSGKLDENSVCAKYAQTADDGKNYNYKFYSLAAIIAVGYRTNSDKATQFRQWATKVLDAFTKQGYVLDKSRLVNGKIFDEDYFDQLVAEIQEIRASERRFYQKIINKVAGSGRCGKQ